MTRTQTVVLVSLLAVLAPLAGPVAGATSAAGAVDSLAADTPGDGAGVDRRLLPRSDSPPESDEQNGSTPGAEADPPAAEKVQNGLLDYRSSDGTDSPDRVTVVVEAVRGEGDRVARLATRQGRVDLRHDDLVRVTLPRRAILALADHASVRYVRRPLPVEPVGPSTVDATTRPASVRSGDPSVTGVRGGSLASAGARPARGPTGVAGQGSVVSEGVETIGADVVQDAGYDGSGVTVAVVDVGFDVDSPEIAEEVARTKDFSGSGMGGSRHGTATAEIVADVAPGANLVLVKVTTYQELLAAVDWIDAETDVDVVSLSLGIPGGLPLDGSARLDREIDESVGNGTTWMVSAGNEAQEEHWHGEWQDGDGDGRYNFTASDETLALDGPVTVRLQWNDWNGSDQDYDAFLLDGSGTVVAASENDQSGTQRPTETIDCGCPGTHYLVIERVDADGSASFDVFFSTGADPEYSTSGRSLTVPATARHATAVGSVADHDRTLEPYSSRGPTKDGRRKPELVAPDRVSTSVYGTRAFTGTSAAAPHAAGTAALLLDANESMPPGRIQERLRTTAASVTPGEPNNRSGWGLIDARAAIVPPDPSRARIAIGRITDSNDAAVPVEVSFPRPLVDGRVTVRLTGPNGSTATDTLAVDPGTETTRHVVDANGLSDGPVTASARVVTPAGETNPAGFAGRSETVSKDATPPGITDFSASATGHGRVRVAFEASEPLDTVNVIVTDSNETTVAILRAENFTAAGGRYTATTGAVGDGNYTATLRIAADDFGNDGGYGQSATASVGAEDGERNESGGASGSGPSGPRGVEADRVVANRTVGSGGEVSVRTEVTAAAPVANLSVTERVSPTPAAITLQEATVVGGAGNVTVEAVGNDSLALTIADLEPNATLSVAYAIGVPDDTTNGTNYTITGTVTGPTGTVATGTDEVTVVSPTAPFRNESGVVDTAGLVRAIQAWGAGDVSTATLREVIRAWEAGASGRDCCDGSRGL